eukprot:Rhum_TRINITY_DN14134_c0_g1::Rhum_TRINITY_DN14134_c0_g1_i2::g.70108::m.70108
MPPTRHLLCLAALATLVEWRPAAAQGYRASFSAEDAALREMHRQLRGEAAWGAGWEDGDSDPCAWSGVSCSRGRVRRLALSVAMRGSDVPDLTALEMLEELSLAGTGVTGLAGLPASLSSLDISGCAFGVLSTTVLGLPSLLTLRARNAGLSGITSLPAARRLETLDLSDNPLLRGSFNLSHYPAALHIDISHTNLGGVLPPSLPPHLRTLSAAHASLTGPFPSTWASSTLFHLNVAGNSLAGARPTASYLSRLVGHGTRPGAFYSIGSNCFACNVQYVDLLTSCGGGAACLDVAGTKLRIDATSTVTECQRSLPSATFPVACLPGYRRSTHLILHSCTSQGVVLSGQLCEPVRSTSSARAGLNAFSLPHKSARWGREASVLAGTGTPTLVSQTLVPTATTVVPTVTLTHYPSATFVPTSTVVPVPTPTPTQYTTPTFVPTATIVPAVSTPTATVPVEPTATVTQPPAAPTATPTLVVA